MTMHCISITLHHTATNCIPLQHTATHYYTLLHPATPCYTLLHIARCKTLQHITHCNTLHHTATHCRVQDLGQPRQTDGDINCNTQHTATHCITLYLITLFLMSKTDRWRHQLQHTTHFNTLQHTASHYNSSHYFSCPRQTDGDRSEV